MRRSASEIINDLENRIARLENKSASASFKVSVVSDHTTSKVQNMSMGLRGLAKLIENLERKMTKEIGEYLLENPDDSVSYEAEFDDYRLTPNGSIQLGCRLHTNNDVPFSYYIEITDVEQFALLLMSKNSLFSKMIMS